MPESETETSSLESVSKIVSAYVSNNSLPSGELPDLITTVREALQNPDQVAASTPEPAVSIKRSIRPNYVVCLEDGKKLKMLKGHLRTAFNMTPDEYRQKWGLSSDYPMVVPKIAARRSEIAKKIGLGRKPGQKVKGKKVRG